MCKRMKDGAQWHADFKADNEKHVEALAVHVVNLAIRTRAQDEEEALEQLQWCCWRYAPEVGGVHSLALMDLPLDALNTAVQRLQLKDKDKAAAAEYVTVIQLVAALVELALTRPAELPSTDGGIPVDATQLKGLAAVWVAFIILILRPSGKGCSNDFKQQYNSLGEQLFKAVGVKLNPSGRGLQLLDAEGCKRAGIMLNVLVAGTRLYIGWKQEGRERTQSKLLFAVQVVESVSSIAASAHPAAGLAGGPAALIHLVLQRVFLDWNEAREAEEAAINECARMYFSCRLQALMPTGPQPQAALAAMTVDKRKEEEKKREQAWTTALSFVESI